MPKPMLEVVKRTPLGTPVRAACPLCDTEFSTEAFDDDETYAHEQTLNAVFEAHFEQVHTRADAPADR